MYRTPNPLNLDSARALMNDRWYQDKSHSEYGDYVAFVTDMFKRLYPEPVKQTIRIGPVTAEPDSVISNALPSGIPANSSGPRHVARAAGNRPKQAASAPISEPDPGQMRLRPSQRLHEFAVPPQKPEIAGDPSYDEFLKALRERPSMPGAKTRRAWANVYAFEGGMRPDPESGAVAGVLPKTLRDLKDFEERPGVKAYTDQIGDLPDDPRQLTPVQAARFHETYLNHVLRTVSRNDADRRLGIDLIEDIDDPKTAAMFVNTLVRHGSGDGAKAIQKAINSTLTEIPMERRHDLGWDSSTVDGKMGPGTFKRFMELANLGFHAALRRNLKDIRDEIPGVGAGDEKRTQYFNDPY